MSRTHDLIETQFHSRKPCPSWAHYPEERKIALQRCTLITTFLALKLYFVKQPCPQSKWGVFVCCMATFQIHVSCFKTAVASMSLRRKYQRSNECQNGFRNIMSIGDEEILQSELCFLIWKDLNCPQLTIQSRPHLHLPARMLPPACSKG